MILVSDFQIIPKYYFEISFPTFVEYIRRPRHMLPSLGPTFNSLQVKFYSLFDEDHYYIERDIHGN